MQNLKVKMLSVAIAALTAATKNQILLLMIAASPKILMKMLVKSQMRSQVKTS